MAAEPVYVVDVLLYLTKETAHSSRTGDVRPYAPGGKGEMQVGYLLRICRSILTDPITESYFNVK